MPLFDLFYPAGALDEEARGRAVERLTTALLRHEGADPDNEVVRGMAWGFVHELPAGCIAVGGRAVARPVYRVMLTVPKGTLLHGPGPAGAPSRRNLVREVTEILLEAEGTPYSPEEALRVYCIIGEVEDGHWGGFGTTFRMEDIVAVGMPEAGDTPLAAQVREHAPRVLREQVTQGAGT
ncbi:MAG TPA: 4-oxalocrotonate tautomerase [Solirubrobacteraceae bacterium]|jgi:phenylpyruvate tautomerase PptA (4-oxalocrotonate tautomerase family)